MANKTQEDAVAAGFLVLFGCVLMALWVAIGLPLIGVLVTLAWNGFVVPTVAATSSVVLPTLQWWLGIILVFIVQWLVSLVKGSAARTSTSQD